MTYNNIQRLILTQNVYLALYSEIYINKILIVFTIVYHSYKDTWDLHHSTFDDDVIVLHDLQGKEVTVKL